MTSAIVNNGGCSIALNGELPRLRYMVSLLGYESILDDSLPISAQVLAYIEKNKATLARLPEAFIGAWLDSKTGKVYLDLSVNLPSKAKAQALALQNKQVAYFDLNLGEAIRL